MPIFEILIQNFRTKDIVIQGEGENKQFYDVMAKGTLGMQTFDQNLLALVKADLISEDIAKSFCTRKTELGLGLDRLRAAKGIVSSDLGVLEMAPHTAASSHAGTPAPAAAPAPASAPAPAPTPAPAATSAPASAAVPVSKNIPTNRMTKQEMNAKAAQTGKIPQQPPSAPPSKA